jgi:DNA-directed RNA polymerase specialized sigma24 family protein
MADIRFPTTHWTLLMQARGSEARAKEALHHLCSAYWFPLFSFARLSLRVDPHEAEDLTQSFFEHLLLRQVFSRVERQSGNFRNYLLVAFRNFHRSGLQKARAGKRGGSERVVPLDISVAEKRIAAKAAELETNKGYDRAWALEVLNHAYKRTELHYSAQGKLDLFRTLRPFLEQLNARSYEELAGSLGKSEGAIRTEVFRLRRVFTEAFRSVVAETVMGQSEVEEEVGYLVRLLTE